MVIIVDLMIWLIFTIVDESSENLIRLRLFTASKYRQRHLWISWLSVTSEELPQARRFERNKENNFVTKGVNPRQDRQSIRIQD
jgi:hypothetical protein